MAKKIVLTLYSQPFPQSMRKRSEDMYSYFKKRDIIFCRGFIADYQVAKKIFNKALFFNGQKWIWKKNVSPDIVYDRSLFFISPKNAAIRKKISIAFPFFNSLELNEIMSNKWMTYKHFRRYSPKTVLIEKTSDFRKISTLNTSEIILKPLGGSRGEGIEIQKKCDFRPIKPPFIVQDLIAPPRKKTALISGPHDLRVMMLDNLPFHSFLRIPKGDNLIANFSQGAKIKLFPQSQWPLSVKKVIDEISASLEKFPRRFFTIDLMLDDKGRAYLIELNSRPGIILDRGELRVKKVYYNHIINFLKKLS